MWWRRRDSDLDTDIKAHLDLLASEQEWRGLSPQAAREAARREFGGVEPMKERYRDQRGMRWIDDVAGDLRYALRGLRRTPGFAAVAMLIIALGIGANTAVFSIVNTLMLRSLPVSSPDRLVIVSHRDAVTSGFPGGWDYGIWDQIRQQTTMFAGSAAWSTFLEPLDLAQGGEKELVEGLFVSGEFFTTLGVPAILGRTFTAADDRREGGRDGPVAVISYGLWQRRFGGASDVVGRTLPIDGMPVTIVGVAPASFTGPEIGRAFDVALPIAVGLRIQRWREFLTVAIRMGPEQSRETVAAALLTVQGRIFDAAAQAAGESIGDREQFLANPFVVLPAATGTSEVRRQYARPILVILAVVVLVLLIACANLANLLIARASSRRRELSVRLAIGAGRWRLVRQLLVESLVLASGGALVGVALAAVVSPVLVDQLSTYGRTVVLDVSFDWRVLMFTTGATVITAVAVGMATALSVARVLPMEALKQQGDASDIRRRSLSGSLAVVQIAVSLVLVVAAGLLIRTFGQTASAPLGFDSDRVLIAEVDARRTAIAPAARMALFHDLADAVATIPGVAGAAASISTPVDFGPILALPVTLLGVPVPPGEARPQPMYAITPGWFTTYGMALRAGRDIDARDTRDSQPVVIVNESFARTFIPGKDAIGEAIIQDPERPPRRIVGIVSDAVLMSPRDEAIPIMYSPLAQVEIPDEMSRVASISVRASAGSPAALTRSVTATMTAVDRNLSFRFHSLDDRVDAALAQDRLLAAVSGLFGVLALLVAAAGLHGVTSHAVTGRRGEIGVRMALGGQRADVIRLILRRPLASTVLGITLGLAAAAALTRYLEGLLFGVTPLDPVTFASVAVVFMLVAALAAYLPARRAARLDPVVVLRSE